MCIYALAGIILGMPAAEAETKASAEVSIALDGGSLPIQDSTAVKEKTNIFKKIAKAIGSIFKGKKKKKPKQEIQEEKKFKHEIESYAHRFSNTVDSISLAKIAATGPLFPDNTKRRDTLYRVFGWHPHWLGDSYKEYDFKVLSTIAYFSYEVDPETGTSKQIDVNGWLTTPLIDSAHRHGCDVLLTVTNFGTEENKRFFSNPNAQATLIKNISELLNYRSAQGVNIDFEQVPGEARDNLSTFLATLRSVLADTLSISMTLPAIDTQEAYDVATLEPFIDYFIVMGYGFYGKGSGTAGPTSPLGSGELWWDRNLTTTMDTYQKLVPKPKLLLGLPYFATLWEADNINVPSKANFIGYRSYGYIMKQVPGIPFLEPASQSVFRSYPVDGQSKIRQLWFENDVTLGMKYDWVKSNGFGGVGIWALGFDSGRKELWDLLRNKFTIPADTTYKPQSEVYLLDSALTKKLDSLAVLLLQVSVGKTDTLLMQDSVAHDDIKLKLDSIQTLLLDTTNVEQQSEITLFLKDVKTKVEANKDLLITVAVLLALFVGLGIISSPARAPVRLFITEHKQAFLIAAVAVASLLIYLRWGVVGVLFAIIIVTLLKMFQLIFFHDRRLP